MLLVAICYGMRSYTSLWPCILTGGHQLLTCRVLIQLYDDRLHVTPLRSGEKHMRCAFVTIFGVWGRLLRMSAQPHHESLLLNRLR